MKRIYIAGPITGVQGFEERFKRAERVLRDLGYEPVNPCSPGQVDGFTYKDYIDRGFSLLMSCDGVLMLPGFMDSKGAVLEFHYALAVGLEVMRFEPDEDEQTIRGTI